MATNVDTGIRHTQVHTEVTAGPEVIIARLVLFIFGVIEVFLALRFLLLLLGANAAAGFVNFVYAVSAVFMAPFYAVLRTDQVSGATFEWSALIAMVVYALIAWGILALINALVPREAAHTVERVEAEDTTRDTTQEYDHDNDVIVRGGPDTHVHT